ncbi:hypothetical protein ACTD5D_17795 [Nocardia takedensis]|uniref:hypothetical protein n=1 Tax=Nocardia takedensis TaxID=259390 RepID=UPI0003055CD2|nr:hypothetical protein [Nocardia takedensis]
MSITSDTPKVVSRVHIHEIVNYFGKCHDCGYPATAAVHVTTYRDGTTESAVVATCGTPCGWSGPAAVTTMSGEPPVVHEGRSRVTY